MEWNWTDPEWLPFNHLLLMFWGLADCFFGYRIIRLTLGLLGALLGALLGWEIVNALLGTEAGWIGMLGGALGGLLLGSILLRAGLAMLGASLGVMAVSGLLTGHSGINEHYTILLLLLGGLAGASLAMIVMKPALIVATAASGSFRAVFAGWFFVDKFSFVHAVHDLERLPQAVSGKPAAWIIAAVLAVLGILHQFRESSQRPNVRRPDPAVGD